MKKLFVICVLIFSATTSFAHLKNGLSQAQERELSFRKNLPTTKYTSTELSLRNRYIKVFGEKAFLSHGADKLKYSNIMEVMIKDGAAAKAAGRTLDRVGGIGSTGLELEAQ